MQPGLRADGFHFDVVSNEPANSGNEAAGIISPKLSLLFGPWADTEFYVNAGSAEAGPASQRYGVERSTYWQASDWLRVDHEVTLARAELLEVGADDQIPGAVPLVMNTGIIVGKDQGFFGSLRSRYFSPRPLIEDGSVDS